MPPQDPDLSTLERLRQGFLAGTAGQQDYWRSARDLAAYDATFAQRIGWKWDFVLEDLMALGWKPPAGPVLDWGCGSGIAGPSATTSGPCMRWPSSTPAKWRADSR